MIFVAAGTQDGRELVAALLDKGYDVAASVVSQYGEQLLRENGSRGLIVNDKPLDAAAMEAYFLEHDIKLCLDASHPYAANVSENAMQAAHKQGIPYLRFERDLTALDYKNIHIVHSYAEAAGKASFLGKRIFLTTGSRNLKSFLSENCLADCVVTARVLPATGVMSLCEEAGLRPGQIVAMQGPFSVELNKALFLHYKAEVIITKNSGSLGGTDTKLQAASELGLPVVVIDRPRLSYDQVAYNFEDVLAFVQENM